WEYFCVTLKEPAVILVVQEFYASFRYQDSRRLYDAVWETVMLRDIDMDNIVNYLSKRRGEWNHRPNTRVLTASRRSNIQSVNTAIK
ncbi:hypothetical protein Goarm_021640, partial [Gossypium armourianum]|nr:hypothetical protein [Gossypium armourianum]